MKPWRQWYGDYVECPECHEAHADQRCETEPFIPPPTATCYVCGRSPGMERFALTEEDLARHHEANRQKLAAMTEDQRRAYIEAEEADATKDALSDEPWGKA